MHLIESLLDQVGFTVQIVNPYASLTKGELVKAASDTTDSLVNGAAKTLSCAKQDGRFIQGGNSHYNCGLCVACLTRRGSFVGGGVQDETPYLLSTLNAAGVGELRARRNDDVRAVGRMASRIEQFDEFDLVAQGSFPPDYDYELGADLVRRGFGELDAILKADQ